jgi:hypothetical protein
MFEKLNEVLNYDKNELGEVAFPYGKFRDMFEVNITELVDLLVGIPRDGSHQSAMQALIMLNDNETKRE